MAINTGLEWDAVAELRLEQIRRGTDVTYRHILMPSVLGLLGDLDGRVVLDAGCGLGFMSAQLASTAKVVIGVDPSATSITLARRLHPYKGLRFKLTTVEEYVPKSDFRFDYVVSNMVLQCVENLEGNLLAMRRLLTSTGSVVVTIPHPCFWPIYASFPSSYDYRRDIVMQWRYKISTDDRQGPNVTHFYRSLSRYLLAFSATGFRLADLQEPMPEGAIREMYPEPWRYPRYLALRLDVTS